MPPRVVGRLRGCRASRPVVVNPNSRWLRWITPRRVSSVSVSVQNAASAGLLVRQHVVWGLRGALQERSLVQSQAAHAVG